jgi:hypothetical protein
MADRAGTALRRVRNDCARERYFVQGGEQGLSPCSLTPPGVTKHGDTDLPGTNPMRSKRLVLIAGVALVALGHRRSAFD